MVIKQAIFERDEDILRPHNFFAVDGFVSLRWITPYVSVPQSQHNTVLFNIL